MLKRLINSTVLLNSLTLAAVSTQVPQALAATSSAFAPSASLLLAQVDTDTQESKPKEELKEEKQKKETKPKNEKADDEESKDENSEKTDADDSKKEGDKPDSGGSDKPTVTKQKLCQLLIQTNDVNLRLLKAGTLLTLTKKNKVLVARLNRVTGDKIFATLRKKDCTSSAIGAVASRRTDSPADSSPTGSSGSSGSDNSVQNTEPDTQKTRQDIQTQEARKSDDGPQILLGVNYLSLKTKSGAAGTSDTPLTVRPTYEFFFGPADKGLRRSREGAVLGLGLSLVGFERFLFESKSSLSSPAGYLAVRGGFRWISHSFAAALMPTFEYLFMAQTFFNGVKTVQYFPENSAHKIGGDIQTDFRIDDNLRLIFVLNYTLFYIAKVDLTQSQTQLQLLTGIKWDQ